METGIMGSIYTTVEGLLDHIHDNIKSSNPFGVGDSAEDLQFKSFLNRIKELKSKPRFTLVLDDPLANSFIYSNLYPEPDPQITVKEYERTQEQNEELGITDMKTD
eukprot:TRINITY_DN2160_c0_g1_i24.p1 TRINITY_DN2160_c0_g1~~TRINITY_DN2160_c0_g1_i24.p1  ORF type:complete len:106 (-),score=32.08 TRINITY_DN2160_c0_g1_i24:50-367(-)